MPRVSASNGIRPEIRALGAIQLNKPVTPTEINDHVGTGNYAAKYITFLRRMGFNFDTTKDGRTVTGYILVSEPANAAEIRAAVPKAKTPKVTVNLAAAAEETEDDKPISTVGEEETIPLQASAAPTSSSSIDPDFDDYQGDVRELIVD